MLKEFIIFSLSAFLTAHGMAQNVNSFDEYLENYPEVVVEIFSTNVTNDDKTMIERFIGDWNSDVFTNSEKIDIIRTSNAFLDRKARSIHYWMFWRCMLSFKETGVSEKGYEKWIEAFGAICLDRRQTLTSLQTLMTATLELLDKHLIYSSSGNSWKCSNDDYRFDFDGEQLSVIVDNCDLYCISKGDSIAILQTAGRMSMNDQLWNGRGGIVTWERAGFATSDVSARLSNYTINMKQSEYEADSVWFTHSTYFSAPVMGKLVDKVRHNANTDVALYPEFTTYNRKFVFEDLYPEIDYEGGISIQGARVIGAGTDDEKALIHIQKWDSLWMNIKSNNFVFRKDRINARNVSLNIYMYGDSIYHNNLSFSYIVDSKEVSIIRSDAASSQAPYIDSYHKMNMNFEQLIWKTDEPLVSLSMTRGASVGRANFRSLNYYDQSYFESLQPFGATNPLIVIRQFVDSWGSRTFPAGEYAKYLRRSVPDTRVQLIEIAKLGFIIFDSDKDEATVQQHLYEFLAAAAKRTDFDVIDIRSSVNAPEKNAILDVKNLDLIINGMEKFMVSDSQQVIITPRNKQLVMKKNRSIDIDGRIDAGRIELYGESLLFNYDDFKINLSRVDSLYMHVPTGEVDRLDRPVQRRLKTAIEKLSGSILIDHPNNKSGRRSLKQYPVLNSDSASYVYYDTPDIEGGAYGSETFYFELDPFVIDSIYNLKKESLALTGKFVSADIFTDMRQTLRVQPDYSLGFTHSSDTAISAYSKSQMHAEMKLSNRGLEASGKLDYLTASIHTDNFRLYPDSMNVAAAKEFVMMKQTAGTEFPFVKSEGNRIHWEPKNDKMYIYKKDKNFNMYNPETWLDGSLLLTPAGLSGSGRMDIGTAEISSQNINFMADKFISDTSDLRLRAVEDGPYRLMSVDSLRSEIDFSLRKGRFIPNNSKDYTLVDFPSNKFAAHVEEMIWEMDSAKLQILSVDTLARPIDFKYWYPGESRGSRYYSTAADADSLSFVAPLATLDMNLGVLKAEGVSLVKTGDAVIYPGRGQLTVTPEGMIETTDTRITFNDSLKQHTVYGADIRMRGRRQYSGFGKYDYVDETGTVSVIDIPEIATDKSGKTTANGVIPAENSFMLSPFFRYQGNMILASDEEFPVFDGAAQIVQECSALNPAWYKFKSPVNPDSIIIPVDEAPVNINNVKIYNGLFITNDSIYPTLFSLKRTNADKQLINAAGVLTYSKDSMIYFIAPESKLRNRDTTGNLLALNRDRCLITGEGRLSLGVDLGRVTTDVVGKVTHNLNNSETTLDVMISFNFHFDDALAMMAAAKMESVATLSGVDMQRKTYVRGMNEWLGVTKSEAFRRDALMGKVQNFPEELKKTLVLTQLQLYWNQATRSYCSTGKIGVGNLFGHQVNRLVDGFVEITKRTSGDYFDIYLKLDDDNWFYFGYTRELMQIVSSDKTFNDRIVKIPERQRRLSERRPGFTYMIASADKLNQFMRQYQQRASQQLQQPDVQAPNTGTPAAPPQQPVNRQEEAPPVVEIE